MNFRSNKMTKVFTVLLVITMVISTMSSVFAAQRFTDVPDGHWAKEHIEKMHELGIMTGDEDFATFKPDEKVGELEGIVAIAKLIDVDVELASKAIEYNKDFLEEMNISNEDKKSVAIALSAGIISKSSLKQILDDKSSEYITKVDACIFLARAMNLQEEVDDKELVFLPFTDVELIPKNQEAYIEVMMDHGIVSKQGDEEGKFNPESSVSRAVMATMLSRAYDYIQENNIKISLGEDNQQGDSDNGDRNSDEDEDIDNNQDEEDEDVSEDEDNSSNEEEVETFKITGTVTGTLKTKDTINIKILRDNGEEILYQAKSDINTVLDGEEIDVLDITKDVVVEAEVTEHNEVLSINGTSFEGQYTGKITSLANVLVPFVIIDTESGDGEMAFYGADDMIVLLNGNEVDFNDLKRGDYVDIKTTDDEVIKIVAQSKNKNFHGILQRVDFEGQPLIVVNDNDTLKEFKFDDNTQIIRNGKEIPFIDLKLGDDIKVYTEYNKVTKVVAEVVRTQTSGILSSILIANTSKVTITNNEGKETEYIVASGADIKIEGKYKAIYDLRLGHKVNMELEGNVIVSLSAEKIEQETRYIGHLIYTNEDSQVIVIKTDDGQNKMINTTKDTRIIDVEGKNRDMDSLDIGDELLVVCNHDEVTFIAKNIVIMRKNED
ncbi:S-layer homology domain-containing protein [Sporosalibacterium faouarense]|uniref:S-layer homology domain-containing protein n=1 Tax=Sporosalibacterium faouarense TaxID=516123 RepID=UPI00141CEEE7|nr:S-layer homology domain-containing protein [Sporosalibacterium faouarense]MTI48917.1 S-layer homology domain-containing protein [Bacillota bacterium]